jgi:hypothetical protein
MLAAWLGVFWRWRQRRPTKAALIALGLATANALYSAGLAAHYRLRPSALPPWQDPQELGFASFFFLAPLAMVVGFVAVAYKAPKWLVAVVELSSIPLLVIGFYASAGV